MLAKTTHNIRSSDMKECTFELNGQPMSSFKIGASSFPAFSGLGEHINRRVSACIPSHGPIPPGEYFILDRESGGRLGWLRDLFSGRTDWFALYANDGKIDDETWCAEVKRGRFRLHPKGPRGVSEGCIVIDQESDFQLVRAILRSKKPIDVEGTDIHAWAKVIVK